MRERLISVLKGFAALIILLFALFTFPLWIIIWIITEWSIFDWSIKLSKNTFLE